MSLLAREREAKLALLESIARSQTALSRMLETIADGYELAAIPAAQLMKHIDLIAKCQQEMAESIHGISLEPIKKGSPAPPGILMRIQRLCCSEIREQYGSIRHTVNCFIVD